MQRIVHLIFESFMLKKLPRSGYQFLGSGKESVAEHTFMITFLGFVMSRMEPDADAEKLITMCLLHDLPEARMGDLNYVQKRYVKADEKKAIAHLTEGVPFGDEMKALLEEFHSGEGLEARLARDADQIAFLVDLKVLADTGRMGPEKWMDVVKKRLCTDTGRKLVETMMGTDWDGWWLENYVDPPRESS